MHKELTNLLPPERQRALARDYIVRLCMTAFVLFTALIIATAILSLPTYVFLSKSASTKAKQLKDMEPDLSLSEETALAAQLAAFAADAAALVAIGNAPSASAIVRSMLEIPRPGISLFNFSYTPAAPKKPGTLTISGIAATRGALRAYQLAIQSVSFASTADLPVSAYAKDADISFTITVTISS